MNIHNKIGIIAAHNNVKALELQLALINKYNFCDLNRNQNANIDVVIAIGGDGLMLHLLHRYHQQSTAIYGINCGTVGFLMNSFNLSSDDILTKIAIAQPCNLHPLSMLATDIDGNDFSLIAFNEVALLRQTSQACKISIKVNQQERLACLISDGVLVATACGSTAYNFSVGGSIIPFNSPLLALTPISPFRPRKWSGALLPNCSNIILQLIEAQDRPAIVNADWQEIKNISKVMVKQDFSSYSTILFDNNHSLEERILQEQFVH